MTGIDVLDAYAAVMDAASAMGLDEVTVKHSEWLSTARENGASLRTRGNTKRDAPFPNVLLVIGTGPDGEILVKKKPAN